mgnify:CR=1 FL=1
MRINLDKIIDNLEDACRCWSACFSNTEYSVVFNKQLKNQNPNEIKYILIGDNPGKDEKSFGQYFVGDAGLVSRLFFERFLVNDFDKEVLCLNKTPISTNTTKELEKLQELQCNVFIKSQTFMANVAYNLYQILGVPVIICGFSGCRQATPLKWSLDSSKNKAHTGSRFFAQIRHNFNSYQDDVYLIKHFSRNCFFEDFGINEYRNNKGNCVFCIGEKYRNELFNSYKRVKKPNKKIKLTV